MLKALALREHRPIWCEDAHRSMFDEVIPTRFLGFVPELNVQTGIKQVLDEVGHSRGIVVPASSIHEWRIDESDRGCVLAGCMKRVERVSGGVAARAIHCAVAAAVNEEVATPEAILVAAPDMVVLPVGQMGMVIEVAVLAACVAEAPGEAALVAHSVEGYRVATMELEAWQEVATVLVAMETEAMTAVEVMALEVQDEAEAEWTPPEGFGCCLRRERRRAPHRHQPR